MLVKPACHVEILRCWPNETFFSTERFITWSFLTQSSLVPSGYQKYEVQSLTLQLETNCLVMIIHSAELNWQLLFNVMWQFCVISGYSCGALNMGFFCVKCYIYLLDTSFTWINFPCLNMVWSLFICDSHRLKTNIVNNNVQHTLIL